ncbi:MAG: ATP-binding protein [Candidatus Limnocylindrales bacterium]
MPELPTGTVTFLFTDIEGSTRILSELGPEAYGAALAEHRSLLRNSFARHGGFEVDTQGDAFFVAFGDAAAAVHAADEAQHALADGPIRVRMGLHTGMPHLADGGYVGHDVHLGARIAAAGHGGQVLLSKETRQVVGDAVELLDLGEHRLKDFAAPVWIYQLGGEPFPPLKTISNTNLPKPASSFVGRSKEVADIRTLLSNGTRLLTLTGPGGTGKTRLAIETAAELVAEFRNGTFWVDLAPLREVALVTETIAQTLGAKDVLAEHIGDRQMLLLLDNLEQVVESAADLSVLLRACPNLRLLVTSRELLRVSGEIEYAVPPLDVSEAVALFSGRSGLPPGETIAQLCRRLDNLPLAVELAAARASMLSPEQILDRLARRLDLLKGGRDADPRQRTLRATIAWSYDLLKIEEQTLFGRLSVFRGGCTVESAEAVCDADLDVLGSLVDQSLLRHANERFSMLETIREYALERLEDSEHPEVLRRRHAEHFLALAEEAEPNLLDTGAADWHERLEREHDNFRAALDHLESSGETERALRLAGAIAEFWDQRAHHVEGRRRLEGLLRDDERPTAARAKALDGVSMLAAKSADMEASARWAEEALALHRTFGNSRGIATSLWQLGYLHLEGGDHVKAEQLAKESVRLFREVGDDTSLLWATRTLAFIYYTSGDLERARPLYEDDLRRAHALGNKTLEATLLGALANVALDQGRLNDAVSIAKESLRLLPDVGDRLLVESRICSVARVLAFLGRAAIAARLVSHAESLYEETGAREPWVAKMNEKTIVTIHRQLDEAAFAEAWEQGRKLTADEAVIIAVKAMDEAGEADHV